MGEEKKTTIIIAEDSKIIQEKLKLLIESENDFDVLSIVDNGIDAVTQVKSLHPDIILLDIEMESSHSGIQAASEIRKFGLNTQIIMLTVMDDEEYIIAAFEAGADDYLLKTFSDDEIIISIKAAVQKKTTLNPNVAYKLKKEIIKIKKTKDHLRNILGIISQITPTEISILEQLLLSKKQSEIAEALCIEVSTVKTHINRLLKKFKMKRSSHMVLFIQETCLLDFLKK